MGLMRCLAIEHNGLPILSFFFSSFLSGLTSSFPVSADVFKKLIFFLPKWIFIVKIDILVNKNSIKTKVNVT